MTHCVKKISPGGGNIRLMRAKDLGNITLLGALLATLLWMSHAGSTSCAGAVATLAGIPDRPDPEAVRAALDDAGGQPVAERLDVHLHWIAQGSPLAEASLEDWLTGFPRGSLGQTQAATLEDVALAWPDEALRRAAAGALLANGSDAAKAAAWRAVRGEASKDERADVARGPQAAALGPEALEDLLGRTDDAPLRQLLRAHPDLRRVAIPRLIERLPAGHDLQVDVAGAALGRHPDPWRHWWARVERSLAKLAD